MMSDANFFKSIGYNDAIADAKEIVREFVRLRGSIDPKNATLLNLRFEELQLGYEAQLKVEPTDVNPALHLTK